PLATSRPSRRRTRTTETAPEVAPQAPAGQDDRPTRRGSRTAEQAAATGITLPAFTREEPPVERAEPDRIIPASPFMVVFKSPDLATDDDEPAPSAATERVQQRRRPARPQPRPRRTG
ncbi:DEAD/DEAH box helicase, partial [Microbispora sp. NPDC049125]